MHCNHELNNPFGVRREPIAVDITLLGGFRLAVDGVPTSARGWARRSAAAIVKILALTSGHHLHREQLLDLLWPDQSPDRSAPRLHKAAHFARRAAGRHDAVVLRDDVVWLFPEAAVRVDAVRFEELARRERRELLVLRRLDVLRVAGEWRELAEIAPTDEEAHTRLMRRHVAAGDGAAALRQFRHLERVLASELGVEPGEAARQVRVEAGRFERSQDIAGSTMHVDALLTELADLVSRQSAVLAELAAAGAIPTARAPLAAVG